MKKLDIELFREIMNKFDEYRKKIGDKMTEEEFSAWFLNQILQGRIA